MEKKHQKIKVEKERVKQLRERLDTLSLSELEKRPKKRIPHRISKTMENVKDRLSKLKQELFTEDFSDKLKRWESWREQKGRDLGIRSERLESTSSCRPFQVPPSPSLTKDSAPSSPNADVFQPRTGGTISVSDSIVSAPGKLQAAHTPSLDTNKSSPFSSSADSAREQLQM